MATIALVDDDRNILTSVSMVLEAEGFEVRTYTDGASALTALSQGQPDLRHVQHHALAGGDRWWRHEWRATVRSFCVGRPSSY